MGRWCLVRECQKLGSQFLANRLRDMEDAKASSSNACQECENQKHGWQKVAMSWYPTPESRKWLMAGQKGPRLSAKTNEGDSRFINGETEWKSDQPHLEKAYFKPPSASPPDNVTMSSMSNYFKIMKMCSLSAPLVKTQKAFWAGQEQMVQARWHSNACKTQAR